MLTLVAFGVWGIVCFVGGALVFRNNSKNGEKLVQDIKDQLGIK